MVAALLLVVASAAGCSSVGYYFQAVNGQMELARKARPIPDVISDPGTTAELKARLGQITQMRDFASQELHLPNNGSYRRYADIGRPFVVWNVFAAPEFSVKARQWCFPFAGCVDYKGYFSKSGAEQLAGESRAQHYDVFVGGVPAYSTLGWFDDPVLNTFVRYPDAEIAGLMFHELAHQLLYVKGDSTFNESFAVTVERTGVERWLAAYGTEAQQRELVQERSRHQAFVELVVKYRARLEELYGERLDPEAMRARKQEILSQMVAEYGRLRQSWGGFAGYDGWFEQPLNNAQLASVAIYTQLVPAFERILRNNGGDLQRFYAEVKRLAALPKQQRDAELEKIERS
jgi:predicted aminopeptidase